MTTRQVNRQARLRAYFGTHPTPMTFEKWLQLILTVVTSGERGHLSAHHNLHSLYCCQSDSQVHEFYARSSSCYIDGTPVRLVLAGAGIQTSHQQRFSLMDHFDDLLDFARTHDLRLFYLGSSPEVVASARVRCNEEYPDLHIRLHHGYFDRDGPVLDAINRFRPDILIAGMGIPRQEHWLLHHLDHLEVAFITEAGATLDYFTGAQARPPVWSSNFGLAWAFRLAHDPRRLWRRYLIEPWSLLMPTLRLWLGT